MNGKTIKNNHWNTQVLYVRDQMDKTSSRTYDYCYIDSMYMHVHCITTGKTNWVSG